MLVYYYHYSVSMLHHGMLDDYGVFSRAFSVDNRTGIITANQDLDSHTSKPFHTLKIMARDDAETLMHESSIILHIEIGLSRFYQNPSYNFQYRIDATIASGSIVADLSVVAGKAVECSISTGNILDAFL